jgi:hypothetical protein
MRKKWIGGGSSNIGAGSGDVDLSWAIPDGDGVTDEGWADCKPGI